MNAPEPIDAVMLPEGVSKIVEIKNTKIPNASTFVFEREDHTLGNIIRMQLLSDPNVRFAGYRIPHPLKKCIEFKIQTISSNYTPKDALIAALSNTNDTYKTLRMQFINQIHKDDEAFGPNY
ncbi:hypothetical protein WA158_001326 [Blastocystis sp. Blastoise]